MRYIRPMQCLRCVNEAIPGKALCASCFAVHQKNLEFEGSDEWVEQKLETTRNESRGRQRGAQGPETTAQGLVLTLAPALLALGALTMFSVWFINNVGFNFTPTPESKQSQGSTGGPAAKGPEQPIPSQGQTSAQDKPAPVAVGGRSGDEGDFKAVEPTPTKVPEPTPTQVPEPSVTPTSTANATSTPSPMPTESPAPLS